MARPATCVLAASLAATCAATARTAESKPRDDPALQALSRRFAQDVAVLAGDEMEGRGLGTAGLERAARWIESRLKQIGLKPAFAGGFRQPFDVKTGVERGAGNAVDGIDDDGWTPLGASSSGAFSGEAAFVGYGLEAPPLGYRELDGVDLRGRVVLMLRYEPQERDNGSPFEGRRPSRWSALRYKVHQAREHGAVAVVFVTGPLQDEGKDKLPALANDGPESPAGLPVLQLRASVAQRLLARFGIDLRAFQQAVDRDLRPRSRVLEGLRLSGRVAVRPTMTRAANLAGVLPGRGALAREVVVMGAHYDHLGYGDAHSMRPNERAVHNGADDNASGTVALLLAAERLRALTADARERRTVVFALFAAEEVGLGGSSAFVAHPPFPMERTVAMVNLDMVGRLRDRKLSALGSDSAAGWAPALAALGRALDLTVAAAGDGYGPSDQTPFYGARVPVVHFFTGAHEQYHTPEDDPATLDAVGAARVAELTARLGSELASGRLTPHYARVAAAPALSGDSRDTGAWLGTVPDYSAMDDTSGDGVLLADVRPGGPAERAGLRGKDRIVELAGTRIANLYDMTYALQDHKPGDTVDVSVLREGRTLTMRATLGSRADRGRATPAAAHPAAARPPVATPPAGTAPSGTPTLPPAAGPSVDPQAAAPLAASAEPSRPDAAYFANRPGRDFAIGAGRPFEGVVVEGERHLSEIRQLTFGGENAEAYFSPDGRSLIFQATPSGVGCDQQYVMDLATGESRRVSSGRGRTTCGYFDHPEADRIVYASTEAAGEVCPAPPDRSRGYVWPVDPAFDLYEAAPDGSAPRRLTTEPGYDAEATWCPRGGRLVFTSARDGDLDLYEMDEAGGVRRLTSAPGYDGGAFYSPDCSEIVWRASRPAGEALAEFRELLAQGLVRPTRLELFVMNADGTNPRQVTRDGAASFAPYFHPDGRRIVYSSNKGANPREFDLYVVDKDGGEPEAVTRAPGFDGFPVFSPDGEWLVFASNRANPASHETNLFIARWVE